MDLTLEEVSLLSTAMAKRLKAQYGEKGKTVKKETFRKFEDALDDFEKMGKVG